MSQGPALEAPAVSGQTHAAAIDGPSPAASLRRNRAAQRRKRRALSLGLQLLLLVLILGAWQVCASTGVVNKLFTSEPSSIGAMAWKMLGEGMVWNALRISLFETLVGFAISAIAGTAAGVALFMAPLAQQTLRPFINGLNAIPRIALVPVFILWFGIGSEGRIALIITISFFVMLVSTMSGLQSTSTDHLVLARTLGASPPQRFVKFMMPAALPSMFGGLQLALTYSFMGAVIGELVSGGSGLGALVELYQSTFNPTGLFAALLYMGVAAIILQALMALMERYALSWREIELRGVASS